MLRSMDTCTHVLIWEKQSSVTGRDFANQSRIVVLVWPYNSKDQAEEALKDIATEGGFLSAEILTILEYNLRELARLGQELEMYDNDTNPLTKD